MAPLLPQNAARAVKRHWRRLAVSQTRRPGLFLLAFALLAALAGWRASKLRLVTDFADLLPENQPSVVELHRILGKTRGVSNVFVVLEGPDPFALRKIADTLVARLPALGSPYVESVRSGVQQSRAFLMPRAGLFLPEAELDDLEQRVVDQERWFFKKKIGADLDTDEKAPAPLDGNELQRKLLGRGEAVANYPDGYYQTATEAGTAQVVVVRSAVANGDLEKGRETIERVEALVSKTMAELAVPGVRVGYAGDLVTGSAEYALVRRDVLDVGVVGLVLVLGVVLLFFRTPRALVALGGTIAVGCALTFGFTELTLGHLNVATAFLLSIVAGNGINFGIIWLARFQEERRAGRPIVSAVAWALDRTYGATLTAAGAAATAYAALGIGQFRGFRHFAIIGASGMAFCWIVSYLLLPPIVVLLERRHRRRPFERFGQTPFTHFERPFVWMVDRAPGLTLAISLAVGVASVVAGGRYLLRGALEYDMRKLRSDPVTTGDLYQVSHTASRVLAAGGSAHMIVLADDARDTPVLARLLRERRDKAPPELKPFEDVHTLYDLVPPNQEQRLVRARELARRVIRAHDRGAIDDVTWEKIQPLLPPPGLVPFTVDDLPPELTEPFTEKDGTRGRILYIEATHGQTDSNLHYLLRWADAFRDTQLPNGGVVHGSGYAVIFADLLNASLVDMPRSVLLSLLLTAIAVALFFRRPRAIGSVLGTLALALIWMIGAMAAGDVRLSFINFIALPITFGIGVDYPVNVYSRYEVEGRRGGILAAVRGTGGPVILCSLTTSLGYLALLRAHNQAVRSLGAVAVLGEVSCLVATLVFLPAAITWWERRRRYHQQHI
jgi:predicted RND superfamily exporter protein